jgi:rod shape-determining protein MreC
MTVRRRVIDYGLAGLLLLLPALILSASLKRPERLNGFDQAVLRVSSPLQAAVSWLVEGVGGLWQRYVWLVDVEEENQELRAREEAHQQEEAALRRQVADTAMLEELVGLRHRMAEDTLGARVIAASLNPYFRVIRVGLDRGVGEVEPGMPVINNRGLVGRIYRTFGRYSDVLLATDPASAIPVFLPRSGGRGVLRGLATENRYACKIDHLEGKEVAEGDQVITSGLGGGFPAGLAVGRVTRVTDIEYGLFQEIEVEPAVDFSALDYVLVVLAEAPPPDPGAGKRVRSEAAYGVTPR